MINDPLPAKCSVCCPAGQRVFGYGIVAKCSCRSVPQPQTAIGGAGQRTGGGRNDQKSNQNRQQSAKGKLADLKQQRDALGRKANKTPEDKAQIDKLKRAFTRIAPDNCTGGQIIFQLADLCTAATHARGGAVFANWMCLPSPGWESERQ